MNNKFSVIVPAHNAENHIRVLLNSIASQHFRDYELIVICDSCTDNTEQIALEYGAITENVAFGRDGLSRDRGLDIATGEWILFADDDDWFLHEYVFQQLNDMLVSCTTDVVNFAYIWKNKGYITPSHDTTFKPRVAHVWANAWRHSAIGDARFGDAVFSSDTYFIKAMRTRVNGVTLWDMPMYYYNFMRRGSQTDLFCKGIIKQSPVAE